MNLSPPIGDFTLDERILKAIEEEREGIFIVDLNLPHLVEDIDKNITFIDHHHQPLIENELIEQINPIISGGSTSELPSATCVISEVHDDWDIYSLLGAVGDVGEKAYSVERYVKLLNKTGWSRDDISRLVTLIDSNYIAMDREGVEGAVDVMLENDPRDLLSYGPWKEKVARIDRTIEDTLQNIESVNGFAFMNINCNFNIISKLARIATWEMGYPGAIVLNRGFNGRAQTYFRIKNEISKILNIKGLIEDLKRMGINAGGKDVVMGSIYSLDRVDEVMEMVCKTAGLEGLSW